MYKCAVFGLSWYSVSPCMTLTNNYSKVFQFYFKIEWVVWICQ